METNQNKMVNNDYTDNHVIDLTAGTVLMTSNQNVTNAFDSYDESSHHNHQHHQSLQHLPSKTQSAATVIHQVQPLETKKQRTASMIKPKVPTASSLL